MFRKKGKARKRSIMKGALAGLVGGIAGSVAKTLAERMFSPEAAGSRTVTLTEQVGGHPPSEGQSRLAAGAIHWAFGAVAGAVYGAAVELEPKAGAWRGAAFGVALNKLAHGALTADGAIPKAGLPQTGLADPTVGQNIQERQSEWVIHVVFGVVTDSVRRLVRRGL